MMDDIDDFLAKSAKPSAKPADDIDAFLGAEQAAQPQPKQEPSAMSKMWTRVKQGAVDPLYSELQQVTQAAATRQSDDTLKGNLLRAAGWLDPIGIKAGISGVAKLANMIPAVEKATQSAQSEAQNIVNERERNYRSSLGGKDTLGGAMVRGLANPMNYVGGVSAPLKGGAKKVMGAIAQRAAQASAGAGAEPVAAGTPEEARAEMAKRRVIGAAVGATVAPAAEKILVEPAIKGATKLVNTIRNMSRKVEEGAFTPASSQFLKDADLLGITEFTAGQAQGKGRVVGVEAGLRDIPLLGDKAKLRAGLEQLADRARSVDDRLQREMVALGYGNQEELVKASVNGNRNASRLVGRMADAADDPNRVMQASLDSAKAMRGREVGAMFDDVERSMRGTGDVDLSYTRQYIQDLADREAASLAPNENILREAKTLAQRLDSPDANKSWSSVRKAVSDLGNKAKQLGRGSDPDSAASVALGDVREVMRHDMDSHVMRTGSRDSVEALNAANKAYAETVAPYKERTIRTLIDSTEPDGAMRQIVRTPGLKDRAARVYGMMEPKGQSAFRYALFHDAIEKATAGGNFSPAKLATELENRMGEIGSTFKGPDLREMQALSNVMRHMENTRLGDAVINNGAKAVKWIMPGAAITTAGAAPESIPAIVGMGLLAKFLTQGPGKKFLLASSQMAPGSKQMEQLVSQAIAKMPRIATQELMIQKLGKEE